MSWPEEEILQHIVSVSNRLLRMERKLDKLLGEGMQVNGDKLLDNQDLCLLLKVTPRTLQRYRNSKLLPYTSINRRNYYLESDVYAFIKKYVEGSTKFKRKQLKDKQVREDE